MTRTAHRAFTIVELFVVILIVASLAALTTPTIVGMREKAKALIALSDLRQHSQVFVEYTGDNKDRFPYYLDPDATYTVMRHGDISIPTPYWMGFSRWNIALAEYYGDDPWQPIFIAPQVVAAYENWGGSWGTTYYYGHVFISRPQFWRPEMRLGDHSQRGPTGYTEVAFPSDKGLLRDEWSFSNNSGVEAVGSNVNIGFCDASARSVSVGQFLPSYPGGVGVQYWPGDDAPFLVPSGPVMATMDGVLGRDVR